MSRSLPIVSVAVALAALIPLSACDDASIAAPADKPAAESGIVGQWVKEDRGDEGGVVWEGSTVMVFRADSTGSSAESSWAIVGSEPKTTTSSRKTFKWSFAAERLHLRYLSCEELEGEWVPDRDCYDGDILRRDETYDVRVDGNYLIFLRPGAPTGPDTLFRKP